jgi:hypothetical protein
MPKGVYVKSEEQKRKISETWKEKFKQGYKHPKGNLKRKFSYFKINKELRNNGIRKKESNQS